MALLICLPVVCWWGSAAAVGSESWKTIVPFSTLEPGYSDTCHNYFKVLARATCRRLAVGAAGW